MDLKIEGRQVEMKPEWKEEIERRADDLEKLHPELTHVRVQLTRDTHHNKGLVAEALIVANFPRRHTLTVRKEKETFEEAIRVAFSTMESDLKRFREKRADV